MIRFAKSLCALVIVSNLVSAQTNNHKNILVFSHQSGFYDADFDLNLYINDSNLKYITLLMAQSLTIQILLLKNQYAFQMFLNQKTYFLRFQLLRDGKHQEIQ